MMPYPKKKIWTGSSAEDRLKDSILELFPHFAGVLKGQNVCLSRRFIHKRVLTKAKLRVRQQARPLPVHIVSLHVKAVTIDDVQVKRSV